jgi:hypothetical protein
LQRLLQPKSSGGAVIQVSTSSGVVWITGMLSDDATDLGIRLGGQERKELVGGLAFLNLEHRVGAGRGAPAHAGFGYSSQRNRVSGTALRNARIHRVDT